MEHTLYIKVYNNSTTQVQMYYVHIITYAVDRLPTVRKPYGKLKYTSIKKSTCDDDFDDPLQLLHVVL